MSFINSFKEFLDFLPTASFVLQNGLVQTANSKMAHLMDCSQKELGKFPFIELIHPEDKPKFTAEVLNCTTCSLFGDYEFKVVTRNGRKLNVLWSFSFIEFNENPALLGQLIDITQLKTLTETVLENNIKYSEILDSLQDTIFEADVEGKLTYVNRRAYDFLGYTQEDFNRGFNVIWALPPEDQRKARENIAKLYIGEYLGVSEYTIIRKDGKKVPVIIHSVPLFHDGKPDGIRGTIVDISERKRSEEQMKYLSMHDNLTGLYNRAYFEQELQRLQQEKCYPLAIIVCDIDGLKLVNDTLGHENGDVLLKSATKVIFSALRKQDIIARIGGDEFAILLPFCNRKEAEKLCGSIRHLMNDYNEKTPELLLSLSVGFSSSETCSDIDEMFKEADNNMYREKLYRKQSARSSIVSTLAKMLDARDYITEGHAERLENLILKLANKFNYPAHILNNLRLFAHFHDIGKVGVPDKVLFKPGPFTPDELAIMQQHCEIGYRIAMSAQDLIPIAEWILYHHEWWNGKGYPLGLQGTDIPLECRILAIADAYDAMTNDRPYRMAISQSAALAEIEKCAGTQFDPALVRKFIKVLRNF
ncbi:sensor domain-containing diguanylate cyclase/phosphohydrolase [Phosphitispora fastidiosa]|uniref:sensor domain-containing diguanylate cyclase/phosphohydrolase n=1 Tax=Phosphitispora fastidiosa TaxID=2837202 RepID=UPI001E60DA77|nr:HD domain-containing phosphohydrolase [Phosphitispora fastidiosa]MBU7007277.1 diguanylate cyclase (GGDEF)-like protein/PAS domain S-box-containing protein [Phosphitispora fastidiosa]